MPNFTLQECPLLKRSRLCLLKQVIVTGYVDDIMPYFDQASVFVAPFRIARGVQNKVLQAFACGIPVIASPMGAEGIRCENNQSILLADTGEEYIAHITDLINDPERRKSIIDNALSNIHQFYAWESVLEPLNNMLLDESDIIQRKSNQTL